MAKLAMYARERMVALHSSDKNVTQMKKMLECEGIKTSRSAVSLFLSRYQNTGRVYETRIDLDENRMCDVRNSVILETKQQPVFYFLHGTSVSYFSHGTYLLNKFLI